MVYTEEAEQARRDTSEEQREAHCGRKHCYCTHAGGCYKGWIDHPDGYVTSPCPMCRTELHTVLGEAGPLGKRGDKGAAIITAPRLSRA